MPAAALAATLMMALPAAHAVAGVTETPKLQAAKTTGTAAKQGDASLLLLAVAHGAAHAASQGPAKQAAKPRSGARREIAARPLAPRTGPAQHRAKPTARPATAATPAHGHATGRPHQTGVASYYARHFNGRRMANGQAFDPNSDSIAHRSLPFGTRVRITNLANGQSVYGTVRDRGPYARGRLLDVSPRIAGELGMLRSGVATVAVWRTGAGAQVEIAEAP